MKSNCTQNSHITHCFVGAVSLFIPAMLFASPTIERVDVSSFEHGGVMNIFGSGFERQVGNEPPVMFDLGEAIFVGGDNPVARSTAEVDESVQRVAEDPSTFWVKPSIKMPDGTAKAPYITDNFEGRSKHPGALFYFQGNNSFLGWPAAYGGFETPVDNSKLYVSWHLKMSYDPRDYWAVSPEGYTGSFLPDEPVTINGFKGRFIGVGTVGHAKDMLHFELIGPPNANEYRGYEIVGSRSGAKTTFPMEFAAGTGAGYETPGANKYLRVWEDPNGASGIRLSWTQSALDSSWSEAPVTPNKWHLMEFMLDTEAGIAEVFTDRQLVKSLDIGKNSDVEGRWSPTIALLGFNGKIQEFQRTLVDAIYMDKSFSRVVIGDKARYSQLDSYELQYPIEWRSGRITVKLNLGALDPRQESYLYVVDENGEANEEGYLVCSDCKAPPEKLEVSID